MNRKPVKRIALGAFALVSLLVISTSPLTAAWLIKSRASKIVNGRLPGLASSSLANINVSEGFVQLARSVHSADVPAQKRSLARLAETTQAVDRHYEVHRATLQTAEEREAFEQVMRRRAAYREVRQAVVALVEQGKGNEARRLFDDDCVPKFQAYLAALGGIVDHHAGEARMDGDRILRLCQIILVVQVALLLFFFVYAFFVPFVTFMEKLNNGVTVKDY